MTAVGEALVEPVLQAGDMPTAPSNYQEFSTIVV
jgi:hypothetical protein